MHMRMHAHTHTYTHKHTHACAYARRNIYTVKYIKDTVKYSWADTSNYIFIHMN